MKKLFMIGAVMFLIGSVATAIFSQLVDKKDLQLLQNFANKRGYRVVLDGTDHTNTLSGNETKVGFNFGTFFKFEGAKKLKLDITFGDVEILEAPGNELGVILITNIEKNLPIEKVVYQEGDLVRIDLVTAFKDEESSNGLIQFNGQSISVSNSFKIKIEIPRHYKSLVIDSVSADLKLKKIKVDDLIVHSVSGDMTLDLVSASTAKVSGVSSDMEFRDFQFETLKLDTVSGDAEFKISQPADLSAQMTSISGDLEGDGYFKKYIAENDLKLGEPKHKITINSVSGDVEFSKQ